MNAPDRFELFVLGEGEKKLTITPDTKLPNAATFTFQKEDHTIGNMLRIQLLKYKKVLFAGYKVPHPLEHCIILKVQTTADTTPEAMLMDAFQDLIDEFATLKKKFENELTLHNINDDKSLRDGNGSSTDGMYGNNEYYF
ncbi:RBP11-like subunits of RNA polymerase [Piromyces finnis]|uniref:RBP11-like subunits of RNA polymerase n=1 Tax=Piromyces finnis TaxID=1754191 RepID=A0A1Y1VD84_9FUNG|nr:RBP11-like subunits of RNA polymerase [Piromyces finnis]|eukprot:ORX51807.1 RBP11-like subunits of RNA polymerase [Piromyces finnis]